ncbi:MAG: hypothetical protein LBG83_05305 [Oscillospiraceae bacterium]|jgi:hypothetical protein|nr:hypothetical protein [Oscillospiraceae bacterium]
MDLDFSQISEMLGNMSEDELQNLQEAAQSLFASFGGGDEDESGCPPPQEEESGGAGGWAGANFSAMFTPELLARLAQIMQRMNTRDPRTDLIMALKPHLSRRRQHRAEQAVQMMKMLELLPALQGAMH